MSNIFGDKIKINIFGESHGIGIGAVIEGLPCGEDVDMDYVQSQLSRRAPGGNSLGTSRKESDEIEILSGVFNNKITGAPICGVIRNNNTRSRDYVPELPRPSHADYAAHVKYKGFEDYRGGGHFSGRITAGIVFAGAICRQILEKRGVLIGAHVSQIENVKDRFFHDEDLNKTTFDMLGDMELAVLSDDVKLEMSNAILNAKNDQDSVGGIIECAITGVDAGYGEPFFSSIESKLASMLFSIPSVKGVEFGAGFDVVNMRGSVANDEIILQEDKIKTITNNNGGITGGISNGMPIILRVAIKPTASIAKEQKTVNLQTGKEDILSIKGRHDPCIVPRAVCVLESAIAITILDIMENN